MDESSKALIRQLKSSPSLNGFLQLTSMYKRHAKFFSAQVTLEDAFDTLKPSVVEMPGSELVVILDGMTETLGDDFTRIDKPLSPDWFLPACLLSELHLLQGHTSEAMSYAVFAVKCFTDSPLHNKVYWTVLVCVLLESWLKWAYIFGYKKKFEKALLCYAYIEQLTEYFQRQNPMENERLSSVFATIQLSRFLVLKDQSAVDKARAWLSSVQSGESLLCFLYLTKDARASEVIRRLVETHGDNVTYWVWLGLIERNPAAIRKALSLEAKSWLAWCALAYLQYQFQAYEDCAYSLRVAHKLNFQDYRLPLLRSLLLRDLGQAQQAQELLSFAADLEPFIGLYQLVTS